MDANEYVRKNPTPAELNAVLGSEHDLFLGSADPTTTIERLKFALAIISVVGAVYLVSAAILSIS